MKHHNEKLLLCPRCTIAMKKIKKHDVVLDVCAQCNGMWLDDQEIDKLMKIKL
ncbi:MAG: zf-TFIIB domain-containing protein [Nanoarchaeota archaeon]